jgi:hypothetical protein
MSNTSFVSNSIVFEDGRGYTHAIVCGQYVRLLTKKIVHNWQRLRPQQEIIALPVNERETFFNPEYEEAHVVEGNNWYW